MVYDKTVHIAQQIEHYLNGFAAGDPIALKRVLSNIKDLLNDTAFSTKLSVIDRNKKQKMVELKQKAIESIDTVLKSEKTDELFIDINEILKDLQEGFNTVEMDYWERIREYIFDGVEKKP